MSKQVLIFYFILKEHLDKKIQLFLALNITQLKKKNIFLVTEKYRTKWK